jgi:hypothetical protein
MQRYQVSIVESSYISVVDDSVQIRKGELEGRDALQVDLRCLFGKPFVDYSCTLMVRNEAARDVRLYKLTTSVAMKPKIVDLEVRAKARESSLFKLPIKIAPCELTLENTIDCFSFSNFTQHPKHSTELTATFAPEWMLHHQVLLTADNR